VCKKLIKNSQPFGKNIQKTAGGFFDTLYYAIARTSVRLSDTMVEQSKRLKLGLCNFHLTEASYNSGLCGVSFIQKLQQVPPSGGVKQGRVENKPFSIGVTISKTVGDSSNVTING